jgi:peptide/nickel transport system permease protein
MAFERVRATFTFIMRSKAALAGLVILLAILVLSIAGMLIFPHPYSVTGLPYEPPSLAHPFGTDYQGHDLFSQVAWGSIPSLVISIVGSLGSVLIGLFAGAFSGYYGKLAGPVGGASDVIMAFPTIPLMVLVAVLFYPTEILISGLLILVLWPPVTRVIRAQVASVKTQAYIDAARMSGYSNIKILGRIIVPEVGSLAIAYFILNIPLAIILTTALEFLGVGNPNAVSWGSILYWAQSFGFISGAWWWILAPGITIALVAVGFALLGFSLEEKFNPRLRV